MPNLAINTWVEIVSVVFSLLYLYLLIRENIWCWLFGILGSLLSIYLFIGAKLYSEAILYAFYVAIGFYGWWQWSKKRDQGPLTVQIKGFSHHLIAILMGILLSVGLGKFFATHTDAANPFADASSTIFSFIASFLEAHKVLHSWIYWIMINAFSIWLYSSRGLEIYAGLMFVYFIFSVVGFYSWRRSYRQQQA